MMNDECTVSVYDNVEQAHRRCTSLTEAIFQSLKPRSSPKGCGSGHKRLRSLKWAAMIRRTMPP